MACATLRPFQPDPEPGDEGRVSGRAGLAVCSPCSVAGMLCRCLGKQL